MIRNDGALWLRVIPRRVAWTLPCFLAVLPGLTYSLLGVQMQTCPRVSCLRLSANARLSLACISGGAGTRNQIPHSWFPYLSTTQQEHCISIYTTISSWPLNSHWHHLYDKHLPVTINYNYYPVTLQTSGAISPVELSRNIRSSPHHVAHVIVY